MQMFSLTMAAVPVVLVLLAAPLSGQADAALDSVAFAQGVQHARSQTTRGTFRVDPRTFALGDEQLHPGVDNVVELTHARLRSRWLDQMGVLRGDVVVLMADTSCAPPSLAPTDTAAIRAFEARCPARFEVRIAIGVPRIGTRLLPDGVYDRELREPAAGKVAVRVFRGFRGPAGTRASIYDLVLSCDKGMWRIVAAVDLIEID